MLKPQEINKQLETKPKAHIVESINIMFCWESDTSQKSVSADANQVISDCLQKNNAYNEIKQIKESGAGRQDLPGYKIFQPHHLNCAHPALL